MSKEPLALIKSREKAVSLAAAENATKKKKAPSKGKSDSSNNNNATTAQGKTRTSGRKRKAPNMTETAVTYVADSNGCEHDNPNFWQPGSSQYTNASWRQRNNCCVSLACYNCKGPV